MFCATDVSLGAGLQPAFFFVYLQPRAASSGPGLNRAFSPRATVLIVPPKNVSFNFTALEPEALSSDLTAPFTLAGFVPVFGFEDGSDVSLHGFADVGFGIELQGFGGVLGLLINGQRRIS